MAPHWLEGTLQHWRETIEREVEAARDGAWMTGHNDPATIPRHEHRVAQPMTLAEFLAWEERQETKHEFDGFKPVAMAGGTLSHARLQRNLAISVGGALRGSRCEFLGSDFQLHLAATVRSPDGLVVCERGDPKDRGTSVPVVVFEVLSPATAGTDRIAKAQEYQGTPSVQHYVMLEQDRIGAMVLSRNADGWAAQVLSRGSVLAMPEIGITIPLDDLYTGVELPDAEPE